MLFRSVSLAGGSVTDNCGVKLGAFGAGSDSGQSSPTYWPGIGGGFGDYADPGKPWTTTSPADILAGGGAIVINFS